VRNHGLTIRFASRNEISGSLRWQQAFARERKDHRFYELVEDTLTDGYRYGYLTVTQGGTLCAVQPCFLLDQDLLAGLGGGARKLVAGFRRLWPRFMRARTLMLGCVAGEGHLDGDTATQAATAELLAASLTKVGRETKCALVVLKEFPAAYRPTLECLRRVGFTRIPSLPMTTLDLSFDDFEDYVSRCLSPKTRAKLRRKLRVSERARPPLTMSVVADVSEVIDDIYPLYEKVFERSPLQFEVLTREFMCEVGRRMPDTVRFLLWRQGSRIVAFAFCMVHGGTVWHEYVGFDYSVAFALNLYYRVFRDVIDWGMAQGCKRFYSGSLNYDPKWHLRQSLYPVDLYVRHTSAPVNAVLRRLLPFMEPTRSDPILRNFHNYRELWD
jgi:predicted N-acyltransferase